MSGPVVMTRAPYFDSITPGHGTQAFLVRPAHSGVPAALVQANTAGGDISVYDMLGDPVPPASPLGEAVSAAWFLVGARS